MLGLSTNNEDMLETLDEASDGFDINPLPERQEEFSPGLTPELMELVQAASKMKSERRHRRA